MARDVVCAWILYRLSSFISLAPAVLRFPLWAAYWWCQGIVLAGWWCLAHEAGHGTISEYSWVNHAVGFTLHTAILAPYYAWRETHRSHHRAPMSVERDENYVPRSRSEYGLWPQSQDDRSGAPGLLADGERKSGLDPQEVFEDAPIYVLSKMLIMQLLGWQIYLFTNEMGNPSYPKGTNVSSNGCCPISSFLMSGQSSISVPLRLFSSPGTVETSSLPMLASVLLSCSLLYGPAS